MKSIGLSVTYIGKYTFELFTYEAPYFDKPGIYAVGILSPDGKNFIVTYIGKTDDLSERGMGNHHKLQSFIDKNSNCLGFMHVPRDADRTVIEKELIGNLNPSCNEKLKSLFRVSQSFGIKVPLLRPR